MEEKNSKFWKAFFGSGSVTVFNALRAFVVNKLLAIFLPPTAFACVGQFLNLMSMGQATSSLAMQNGWVSLTAQNKENHEKLLGIWRGGFRMTTFATIFTCIFAVLFCFMAPLHIILPGVPQRLAQAAILFALPGMFASNVITISAAVMNGLGHMRRWALINIVSSLWQILWVAFFLYTGKLSVLSIIATQTVFAGVFAAQMAARAGFSIKEFRKTCLCTKSPWFSFALMGLVPMVLSPIVLTVIRSMIGSTMGWDAAGVWQGIYKISDFFASIFSAVLGVIILPKVSANLTKEQFKNIFNPIFIRLVGITLLGVIVLYLCRSWVVAIFLSSAYAGASDYMLFQLCGDFFRSAGWCLGYVLIARQATKAFLGIEICSQVFWAVATFVGIRLFEFHGPMFAYALENLLTLLALFIVVYRMKWKQA